jgi:hypothetical protein
MARTETRYIYECLLCRQKASSRHRWSAARSWYWLHRRVSCRFVWFARAIIFLEGLQRLMVRAGYDPTQHGRH